MKSRLRPLRSELRFAIRGQASYAHALVGEFAKIYHGLPRKSALGGASDLVAARSTPEFFAMPTEAIGIGCSALAARRWQPLLIKFENARYHKLADVACPDTATIRCPSRSDDRATRWPWRIQYLELLIAGGCGIAFDVFDDGRKTTPSRCSKGT